MKKENTLLILWLIFGFVFIKAVDSVLFLFTNLAYFGASVIGIPYKILRVIIPVITLVSYVSTAFLLLKKLKLESRLVGIYLTEFPKHLLIKLFLIAIFLNPITNKLSGLFAEHFTINQSGNINDYIDFYGWMIAGIGISRAVVLVGLTIIYFNKYNSEKLKN